MSYQSLVFSRVGSILSPHGSRLAEVGVVVIKLCRVRAQKPMIDVTALTTSAPPVPTPARRNARLRVWHTDAPERG